MREESSSSRRARSTAKSVTLEAMKIHKPKRITSSGGLGLDTVKKMELPSDTTGIGTELWGPLDEQWAEGDTVIAREGYLWRTKWEVGKPYIVTKFYDTNRNLVGVYGDICRPVERDGEGFAFDDLYLDVWYVPGQAPVILDVDELKEAVKLHYVAESEARYVYGVAKNLAERIKNNEEDLSF